MEEPLTPLEPRHVEDAELRFLSQYLGQDDLDACRKHLYSVWRGAVAGPAPVYLCIRELMFLEPRLKRHASYPQALQMMEAARLAVPAAPPLWLDIGCAFGTDVRQLRMDGLAAGEVMALDVTPDYWHYGLQLYQDASRLPCAAIFGDITCDDFLSTNHVDAASTAGVPATATPAAGSAADAKAVRSSSGDCSLSSGSTGQGGSINHLAGAVQVASSTAVLHCLPEEGVALLLRKAAVLLRAGGMLLGSTLGAPSPREWEAAYQAGRRRWLHSAGSLQAALLEAGFEHVEVQAASWRDMGSSLPCGLRERMEAHVGPQPGLADRQMLQFKASTPALAPV